MADLTPIKPADLLIDEENPRVSEPNVGQNKVLQALAKKMGAKLQVHAEDIVQYGLDPSALAIVEPLEGSATRYVVLEGNRRLAALKVLENPELVADAVAAGVLKRLRVLSKDYQQNPVEQIMCVVMNRDEARHWITLRHTGENLGAGIVPWGPDEQARFSSRTGKVEPHTQALDFLQKHGQLTGDVRKALPTTSFKRLIDTPAVRSRLGVEVQQGVLYLLADADRVAKALMHVVNDLASGKVKVGAIYTKDQRADYAAKLPASVVVTSSLKSGHGVAASGEATAPKAKTAKTPKKRDRLIPRECVLGIPASRMANIEGELRKLSLEAFTNAVSVLFRVFIELSVDTYIEKHSLAVSKDAALQKKMAAVASDLVSKNKLTDKQRTPVSRACQKDSFLAPSITLVHQFVHNPYVFPAPSDLRAHWDSLQPFFIAMWKS